MPFRIIGKVKGTDQVSFAMGAAPKTYKATMIGWLLSERNMFVGGKTRTGAMKDGVFRKKLMRKRTLKGTSGWKKNAARVFHGRLENTHQIEGMLLRMGAGIHGERPFVKGLRILGEGGTISSRSKFMVLPVYKNLTQKTRTYEQFRKLNERKELYPVKKRGKVLFFKRPQSGPFTHRDLVFVGVRRIRVNKQFDFQKDWDKRIPSARKRGQKRVDTATKRVNKRMFGGLPIF